MKEGRARIRRAACWAALGGTALLFAGDAAPVFRPVGAAAIFAPGIVSTPASEVRIAFSPDGRRALWGTIGRTGGPGGWDIFESERTADGWSPPKPAAFDSPANDFDPSFSPDGGGVYFFSNRPGGLGGDDLYFAEFDAKAGFYGSAVNLGPGINTPKDEWAPAVSPDGAALLFASDGRGGRGKHDLFLASGGRGHWSDARNLEALNTPDEDFDATFLGEGRSIVLSSGDFDGAVRLYFAPFLAGGYGARQLLDAAINASGKEDWTLGPSVSAAESGVLYFSGQRPGGAGRSDIYRIRYSIGP